MPTALLDLYDAAAPGAGITGRSIKELPAAAMAESLQNRIVPPSPPNAAGLVPSTDGEGSYELSRPAADRTQDTLDALFPPKELGRWHKDIAAGEADTHFKTGIAVPPNGELEFEVQGGRALHIVAGDNTILRVPITTTNIGLDVGTAVSVGQYGSDLRNIVYVNGKLIATRVANKIVRIYELTLDPPQSHYIGTMQGISSIKCLAALPDNTLYAIDDSDRLFKFHLGTFRATLVRQLAGGWFSTVVPETLCNIDNTLFAVCAFSGVVNTFDISGRPVLGIINPTTGSIKQHGIPFGDSLAYYTGANGYKEVAGMTAHKAGAEAKWDLFLARKGGDGEILRVRIDDPSDPTSTQPGSTGGSLDIANRALKGMFDSPTTPGMLLVGHDPFLALSEPGAGDAKAAGNFVLDATDQYFFGHKDGEITAGAISDTTSLNPLIVRNRPIQQGRRVPVLVHKDHNVGVNHAIGDLPIVRPILHPWEFTDKIHLHFGFFYEGPSGLINTWKHFAYQREVWLHPYNGVAFFTLILNGHTAMRNRRDDEGGRNDAYGGIAYTDFGWHLRLIFESAHRNQIKMLPSSDSAQASTDVGFQIYSIHIER